MVQLFLRLSLVMEKQGLAITRNSWRRVAMAAYDEHRMQPAVRGTDTTNAPGELAPSLILCRNQ
jgi:hypothetical protein